MRITEVRIFSKDGEDKKLRAFATVTFDDCFVVRDLKIIEGAKGLFVAMPSRRMKHACPQCRHRNVVHSQFCNQCGGKLEAFHAYDGPPDQDEIRLRQSEHKDIAHPITMEFREYIQKTILEAYQSQTHKKEEM